MTPGRIFRNVTRAGLVAGLLCVLAPRACPAQEAVVHAVLFYSPTCPHCHKVMAEDLPPLTKKYGHRLVVAAVDVTTPRGHELFEDAVAHFGLKPLRYGVPTLVVGSEVMVGDREIPERLPGLIARGLAAGGVGWPDVPRLRAALESATAGTTAVTTHLEPAAPPPGPLDLFRLDPVGNGAAVVVLLALIGALFASVLAAARGKAGPVRIPSWALPVLFTVGMAVASYLAFVEVTGNAAVCGPVGDCNAVQQSPYALLFGIVPVGILGQAGYVAMFVAWMVAVLGPPRLAPTWWSLLWGMALAGTLFSAYLTFLEPFVIGASCVWCLTSAVVMALSLLAATPRAIPTRPAGRLS